MENSNDQDDDPKKSHKRQKPTIKQVVKVKREEEKAKKAAPKSRNRLEKYSNTTTRPSGPAGIPRESRQGL